MSLRIPSTIPAEEPSAGNATPPTDGAGPPQGLATAGGFFAEGDVEPKRRLSGPLILGLVIAAAGLMLGAMRLAGIGANLDLVNVKIDYPLDGEGGHKKDHTKILSDLKTVGVDQVPLEEIQMNPFEWKALRAPEAVATDKAPDPAEMSRREREQRIASLKDAASKLQLNSVMAGRVPVARISGEMVKVGDRVGEFFTVKSIDGRAVEIAADDQVFVLSMAEAGDGKR
jgi:hypothetical protein